MHPETARPERVAAPARNCRRVGRWIDEGFDRAAFVIDRRNGAALRGVFPKRVVMKFSSGTRMQQVVTFNAALAPWFTAIGAAV
jgi:hypothetical protein